MEDDVTNFDDVIDKLFNTFSGVVERDVIAAVVISYEGDMDQSANALMSITGDTNNAASVSEQPTQIHYESNPIPNAAEASNKNMSTTQPIMSYSRVSQKTAQNVQPNNNTNRTSKMGMNSIYNMNEIVTHYNNGWRVLLLMRGPPGCGKTHLAREILQATVGCIQIKDLNTHILSSDDYFMFRGVYRYDKYKLQDAHMWNQSRVLTAMTKGISPIIIDNTNIQPWEMEPYVKAGVNNGYIIHVVEPNPRWSRNAHQLFKRNTHNVPIHTIKRMLDNMQEGLTGETLIKCLGLHYPAEFTPPILRQYPVLPPALVTSHQCDNPESDVNKCNQQIETKQIEDTSTKVLSPSASTPENYTLESKESLDTLDGSNDIEALPTDSCIPKTELPLPRQVDSTEFVEIEKRLQEIQKLENEWENGENWDEEPKKQTMHNAEKPTSSSAGLAESALSKPRRKRQIEKTPKEVTTNLGLVDQSFTPKADSNDWSKFLTLDTQAPAVLVKETTSVNEKVTSSTCIELGDTDISDASKPHRIITAVPRDINIFTIERKEKIPIQRMLDKSTSTSNDIISMQPFRCQNEEQHFKAFRKMFRNIPSAELRDIFENCCGDVNWAVEIVIDGMTNNQFCSIQEEIPPEDEEDAEDFEQCECLAAYNIIPDHRPVVEKNNPIVTRVSKESTPSASPRRIRKEASVSDASLQLRRQIEENIVISENHYSERHLKMRNTRSGELRPNPAVDSTQDSPQTDVHSAESNSASTSGSSRGARDEASAEDASDDDDASCSGDVERTVNVNVGMAFIKQLDGLFGRDDMKYPEAIEPKLNMPVTLLNEINALWMESMMHQLEKDSQQTQEMIEQDADFARLLAAKEEEMLRIGREPEVPDFKEIMDLDFALSLYQRDIAEWRNKEPSDLAAKMTREKLYNLFPDVAPDVLSELLMAHENNFQTTVEVLLISTGRSNVLEIKNGVNKFIMEKEMQRKKSLIEEQRKALADAEWPLLPPEAPLSMDDVERFRREAAQHSDVRESAYRKARAYVRRGMLAAAAYYSQLGAFHTALFEQASCRAASSLVHVNAQRCKSSATIDLHQLRVAEARQSLDLFLDAHIRQLKERRGGAALTLFFLTGRGKHSPAGPRVKPAVKKRLKQRGLAFYELNPGLLAAKVTANHSLSDEIC